MSTFLAFLYAAVLSGVPLLYGTLGEIITDYELRATSCLDEYDT